MSDFIDQYGNGFAAAGVADNDPTLTTDHNSLVETCSFFRTVKAGVLPGNDQPSPGAGNPDIVHTAHTGAVFHTGFVRLAPGDFFALASDDAYGGALSAFSFLHRVVDVSLIGYGHAGDFSDDEVWPGGAGDALLAGRSGDDPDDGQTDAFYLHARWFTGDGHAAQMVYTRTLTPGFTATFAVAPAGNDLIITYTGTRKVTICTRVEISPKMAIG